MAKRKKPTKRQIKKEMKEHPWASEKTAEKIVRDHNKRK